MKGPYRNPWIEPVEIKRLGKTRSLGFDTLSAGFDRLNPSRYELLNQRSLIKDYPKNFWEAPLEVHFISF